MNSELLRRAAGRIREQAEAAVLVCGTDPWRVRIGSDGYDVVTAAGFPVIDNGTEEVARHVVSWQPAIAFIVADLLDDEAADAEAEHGDANPYVLHVARTSLGESS